MVELFVQFGLDDIMIMIGFLLSGSFGCWPSAR